MLYKRGKFYWLDIRINGNRIRRSLQNRKVVSSFFARKKIRNLSSYIILICFLVSGCNNQYSEPMRNQKAQFEEWKNTKYVNINFEFLLGSDDFNQEEYMFGTISDIEVDKLGNI